VYLIGKFIIHCHLYFIKASELFGNILRVPTSKFWKFW